MSDTWLLPQLAQFADRTAIIRQDESCTYGELLERVEAWQRVLEEQGIPCGCSVFSPATVSLLLALATSGKVAVPLTTAVAAERERCLNIAAVEWLFVFEHAETWSLVQRPAVEAPPLLKEFRRSGEAGLILFSSGSTGEVKAALHSFPRLTAVYRSARNPAYRTLAFLTLDHIGGLNTLLRILVGGGTVITPRERTPEAVCAAIERHRVQLLPTTPTFLRMLLISEVYKRYDLSSLELITYGTEPMPESTLEALHVALPGVRLKQTYGLTEVGILPTKSEGDDSLWLAVGGKGYETKIVDGVLWIRSPSSMLGYLNAPSPFDADGWLNTGDLVEQKGEYIRILGRASEIINVAGEKVFPAEVENVIQQVENIKEVAVRGRSNPITGNILVAAVELFQPEDPDAVERRVREFCRRRLAPYKVPAMVEVVDGSLCGGRMKKLRKPPSKNTL